MLLAYLSFHDGSTSDIIVQGIRQGSKHDSVNHEARSAGDSDRLCPFTWSFLVIVNCQSHLYFLEALNATAASVRRSAYKAQKTTAPNHVTNHPRRPQHIPQKCPPSSFSALANTSAAAGPQKPNRRPRAKNICFDWTRSDNATAC
ncbi:unnamed protein product [Zymoseptoria tritici ST99CH_3D7]|uniref:Uncharacterized protein n=1 Tax=Zymoseptoria tritici (strain ST99CH_3D7) TaxID=1276538 RepID=A0A1X7RK01_ZYMT9|nr:unnamed protein product [Zymoseptoria tritici ST99CH_3D7]